MSDKVYLINFSYDITNTHMGSCLMKGESDEAVKEKFNNLAAELTNVKVFEVEDTSSNEFIAKEVEKEEARRREMEQWEEMMSTLQGPAESDEENTDNVVSIKDGNKVH
jgi:hypothetical protein